MEIFIFYEMGKNLPYNKILWEPLVSFIEVGNFRHFHASVIIWHKREEYGLEGSAEMWCNMQIWKIPNFDLLLKVQNFKTFCWVICFIVFFFVFFSFNFVMFPY